MAGKMSFMGTVKPRGQWNSAVHRIRAVHALGGRPKPLATPRPPPLAASALAAGSPLHSPKLAAGPLSPKGPHGPGSAIIGDRREFDLPAPLLLPPIMQAKP